jgi:ABC-type antimicrobial peptide transport system permease subunit
MAILQTVRAALAQIDRQTPVTRVRTMEQIALDSMLQPRTQAGLMGAFAAIALLLSGLGIYGVVSYSVAQATRDIGIRMALGADAADVIRLVLGKSMLLTGTGLALGLAAALAASRLLAGLLYHVKPGDPWTYGTVAILLAAVAILAALLPARRATQVDPLVALRAE